MCFCQFCPEGTSIRNAITDDVNVVNDLGQSRRRIIHVTPVGRDWWRGLQHQNENTRRWLRIINGKPLTVMAIITISGLTVPEASERK